VIRFHRRRISNAGTPVCLNASAPTSSTVAARMKLRVRSLADWSVVTHAAVGLVVAPRMWMRRVACSMTARQYTWAPFSRSMVKKSVAMIASAWDRRNCAQVGPVGRGAGTIPALGEDLPYRRRCDPDAEAGEFAVDSSVSPGRVLLGQA
jgi:hypothetical protein